jgi:hypothetical protein
VVILLTYVDTKVGFCAGSYDWAYADKLWLLG